MLNQILSGWWRGEPTTTASAFKWINQLLKSFQTKPLLQMGPAGRRALRLSFCRWKIWKDQGVQRFRHRGGSSRGFSSFRSRGQRIHNNNRSGRGLWLVMTHLFIFVAILNYHEQTDWVLTCDKSLSSVSLPPHHVFELPMIMMWWAIFPKMCLGLTFSVANPQVMQTIGDILSLAETEVFLSISNLSEAPRKSSFK